jgi:hypothetical protein
MCFGLTEYSQAIVTGVQAITPALSTKVPTLVTVRLKELPFVGDLDIVLSMYLRREIICK